jgi:hypothetical protein
MINANPRDVLEGVWEIDSEQMRFHDSVSYQVLSRPSIHSAEFVLRFRMSHLMRPFEVHLSSVWIESQSAGGDKEYIVAVLPVNSGSRVPSNSDHSHGLTVRQLWILRPGLDTTDSTQLTYFFQINLNSDVFTAVERWLPNSSLEVLRMTRELVARIRKHHQRQPQAWRNDVVYDTKRRSGMITRMLNEQKYSEAESEAIGKLVAMLGLFSSKETAANRITKITLQHSFRQVDLVKVSDSWMGRAEFVVRGASAIDIVAYLMDFDSRHNLENHVDANLHVHWELRDILNDHHRVTHVEMKIPPFQNRVFVNRLLWKKISEAPPTFVWGALPLSDADYALLDSDSDSLRAENARCVRYEQRPLKSEGMRQHETLFQVDRNGLYDECRVCVHA